MTTDNTAKARENHLTEISALIAQGRVVPVVGAGVSRAAAGIPSWREILDNGFDYVENIGTHEAATVKDARVLLTASDPVPAAQKLFELLGGPLGEYPRWLKKTFEKQRTEIASADLIYAIIALGCSLIATTNYDKLISLIHPDNPQDITWQQPRLMQAALWEGNTIFHLHGVYDEPASVIFGTDDYATLVGNEAYKEILHTLWLGHTLLFIGCSFDGVTDPDFERFLKLSIDTFPGSPYKHYALLREGDYGTAPDQVRQLLHTRRIQVVKFGDSHDDLPPWLQDLAQRSNMLRGIPPTVELSNLPLEYASFIGRENQIQQIDELLANHRLVSLVGPGGVGKTRLAYHIARKNISQYPDGVWAARLDSLLDPSLLAQEIASTLGVRESPGQPIAKALLNYLRAKNLLFVIDNCEHLVDAVAKFTNEVLSACPDVKILATSRERLNLVGEQLFEVPTLTIPDLDKPFTSVDLHACEATRLFIERAREQKPDLQILSDDIGLVVRICQQLDGIPLAIELAAARIRSMSLHDIVEGLEDRFRLLTGGSRVALPRQRTMQASLDWSYGLLTEQEKIVFRRLSVFTGGWTLEAAEYVTLWGIEQLWELFDILQSLVDKSLFVAEKIGNNVRYQMLGTILEYGKLKSSDEDFQSIAAAHRDYYLNMAQEARREFKTSNARDWLIRIDHERDNMRTAIGWCLSRANEFATGAAFGLDMCDFWRIRGDWTEARYWLKSLLKVMEAPSVPLIHYGLLNELGIFARQQGDLIEAREYHEQGLKIAWALDDERIVASVLGNLANVYQTQTDFAKARTLFETVLRISVRNKMATATADTMASLGYLALEDHRRLEARLMLDTALNMHRVLGDERRVATTLGNRAILGSEDGDFTLARAYLMEALDLQQKLNDKPGIAKTLGNLGILAFRLNDMGEADMRYRESLCALIRLGDKVGIASAYANLGNVKLQRKDYAGAFSDFEKSLAIYLDLGDRLNAANIVGAISMAALGLGDGAAAINYARKSLAMRCDEGYTADIAAGLLSVAVSLRFREHLRASTILGMASAIRDLSACPWSPEDSKLLLSITKALRSTVGDDIFDEAWSQGNIMNLDQAIDYALDADWDHRQSAAY